MCTYSLVIDAFGPKFPWFDPQPFQPREPNPMEVPPGITPIVLQQPPLVSAADIAEWRRLIAEFREALAAAKLVDRVTGQPNCEDVEKAKLVDRVAALEAQLNDLAPKPKRKTKRGRR